jgi:aspartyl-tRNA(Asn)/glutamyl-tRNA(Gln) amidotransferase subunit B
LDLVCLHGIIVDVVSDEKFLDRSPGQGKLVESICMAYEAVIGMEVHIELCTASKMFCGCGADFFGSEPNTLVCPVCMGYPGVLPVINEQAIEYAVRVGLALNCQIPSFSKFDRKNYNYPDLPKGYQISQYDLPLCHDGWIDVDVDGASRRIGIRRAHMEEDTAKEFHRGDVSLIDYNRSGVPLLEIVTEPDIRSGEEARQFLIELRTLLRYLGVSTADMEKGAMRCEPNVSVRPVGSNLLGVKTEIKNLNSFRVVRLAIEHEVTRQMGALEAGETVQQVTMGWNERENRTVVQRSKEYAEDYRYFPEPDLPPLQLSERYVQAVRAQLPELPRAKRDRFVVDYGLKLQDASVLVAEARVADYYEACVDAAKSCSVDASTVGNWVLGELFRLSNETNVPVDESLVTPQALAGLLDRVERRQVNANTGKDVLAEMFRTGKSAQEIIDAHGLAQIHDEDQIADLVSRVIQDHPEPVSQYLSGKESVLGFLIGQAMRASRGKADPQAVRRLLRERLQALRNA